MRRPAVSIGFATAIVLALVACGNSQPVPGPSSPTPTSHSSATPSAPEPTNSVSPTTTVTVTVTAPIPEPQPWSTSPVSAEPQYVSTFDVVDVRVGAHDGFDRVVVELAGGSADQTSWLVQYDPDPHTQGKGDSVDLPGSATLRLIVHGLVTPPAYPIQTGLLGNSSHGYVTGVFFDPVFEGQAQVFIGLDQVRGFRVSTLDSPSRIIVDIQS